jgi:hypothetical protein
VGSLFCFPGVDKFSKIHPKINGQNGHIFLEVPADFQNGCAKALALVVDEGNFQSIMRCE